MRLDTLGLLALVGTLAFPQQPPITIIPRAKGKSPESTETVVDRRANIRVDTTMVLIPVAVTDPTSHFVPGHAPAIETHVPHRILCADPITYSYL